ncbi:MAG: DUF1934 domain-containing protein [Oscillospiraceae bacterium]|jgi:uncharacterized beta-barrel protein YwiB (DUF1934 family)|nr:DUF1934 domain-containing protein [Oscillospiraceae bacterium]
MNNNALISIKTDLLYEDDNSDSLEMITQGQYCRLNNGEYTIKYSESDPENTGNVETTVTITPAGLVTVEREGDIYSHMVFEQGQKHLVHYETEYGSLTVGISAKKVAAVLSDTGGDLEIDYSVEIDNAVASDNSLKVNVRFPNLPS